SGWSRSRPAWSRKATEPRRRIYGKPENQLCGKSWRSLAHLPRPVDRVDIDSEGIGAQPLGIARGLDHDRQDRGPSLGGGELAVLVVPLRPGHTETVRRRPDDARYFDGYLLAADAREGIVGAGIVVQCGRAPVGGELVSPEPVLADDDGVGRERAHLFDETAEVK